MADIKQGAPAPAPAAAQAPARKRPLKKLIILVAGTALLAGSGAGAFVFINRKPAPSAEAAKKAGPHKLPTFVDLDQFTVNLAEKDQDRYMQIKFSLEVAPNEAEATIKDMMPALRSEILLVLGSRQAADLGSREGKEALAKDIVDAANKSLEHTTAEHAVSAVRITQLIIQ
jgi:flagellar protein FliL